MTYASQQLIQATDYNTFIETGAANINGFWGTGVDSRGWGQTALVQASNVAGNANAIVSSVQWSGLVNTLAAAGAHTGTTITARTAPIAGDTIGILANVATDITNINANRSNAAASGAQFTTITGSQSKTTATNPGTVWTIQFISTITWASADAARYFFNAGGRIKIQTNKSSTGDLGDPEWNNLATDLMADLFITGGAVTQNIAGTNYTGTTAVGGTGTPAFDNPAIGFYDLTVGPTATTVYQQFADTAPYTSNYIMVQLARPNTTSLQIKTEWVNTDTDGITGGTASSGATPGTAPCTIVTYFPPSTTNLSASWGTPTITSSVTSF